MLRTTVNVAASLFEAAGTFVMTIGTLVALLVTLRDRDRADVYKAFRNRLGRAIILGRAETAFINVGGMKVPAQEVERTLLQHPAVLWCRVRRCPAPLVGELVGDVGGGGVLAASCLRSSLSRMRSICAW